MQYLTKTCKRTDDLTIKVPVVSPQGPKWTQQEVGMKLWLNSPRNSASIPPLKTQLQESWLSSLSVNRKVMPTQCCIEGQSLCKKTLKFHSDRRRWHLLSSADMPSRNTVQGQLILLPRFLVQWNPICHKTNICKLGFTKKKKKRAMLAMSSSLSVLIRSTFILMKIFVLQDQSSAAWMQSIGRICGFLTQASC